jgi:hypothetical protein
VTGEHHRAAVRGVGGQDVEDDGGRDRVADSNGSSSTRTRGEWIIAPASMIFFVM